MDLTDRERELIKNLIDRGEPLPPKYKLLLFEDAPTAELIWPGKTSDMETVVLPFQSIEQIDEAREEVNEELSLFEVAPSGRQSGGWTNKLIWGDNRVILSSLANGPMRQEIEAAGGLKLVYIDPPFDVGADFSVDVEIGEEAVTKQPSIIEELAYRDTWGAGRDSFLAMLHERLGLIHQLMAPDASIFVHCDWRVSHLVRGILDEVFGSHCFRNEIVWWYYNKFQGNVKHFPRNHDNILYYVRSASDFTFDAIFEERDEPVTQIKRVWDGERGKIVNAKGPDGKVLYQESTTRRVDDVWRIPMLQPADKTENLGYPTQKREELARRIIEATTVEGDLIGDFFCGSGTTMAAAEKLGRKWIGADLGRFAVHTSRKRMIHVQRQLKAESKPYRSFEILNLGKYERQYFVGVNPNLPEEERVKESVARESAYLDLICQAYSAEKTEQIPPFHAVKAGAGVVIGPIDAPVSRATVESAIAAAGGAGMGRVDVLGFEFEMGLSPAIKDRAREQGVELALKYIPNDVFDKRAIAKSDVRFYDVAYVEAEMEVRGRSAAVTLTDFGVFYRQEDIQDLADSMRRKGQSRVTIDNGQIVKITKTGSDSHKREVLTESWTDWIDYWAVDFTYTSQKELISADDDEGERTVWTGRYIFENEWQSYRTRADRSLEFQSVFHEYDEPGVHQVAVKVIDIFGNDTTRIFEVEVQ